MVKATIQNLDQLVRQFRNNENPESIRIESDDPRDLATSLDKGYDNINLFNKGYNEAEDLKEFDNYLEGRKVTLYLGTGQRLFSTKITEADLRFGGTRGKIKFNSKGFDHFEASSLRELGANIQILKGMSEAQINDLSARDIFNRIGSDQIVARFRQREQEPDPEPEPSPGIPEGEEPDDSQREMNPLVIYAIVGILAYVTAR